MGLIYAEQVEYMSLDQMQETHESEIKILNEIEKLAVGYQRGTTKLNVLESKIDEYIKHVQEHFANEEELMEKYDFHAFEMHKMAHDMFLMDLNYASMHWKQHGDLDKILNFIYKTPEWIIMHVNTVDAPTAKYLASKMV
jgi:hemerythrin